MLSLSELSNESNHNLSGEALQFLNADYLISRRLRAQLAHLFGYDVPSCLRDILLQAQPSELAVWYAVEKQLVQSRFKSVPLQTLADVGFFEHQLAQATEAGRQFAGQASAEALLADGIAIRNRANPYQNRESQAPLHQAWSDGFMGYLEMLRGESW